MRAIEFKLSAAKKLANRVFYYFLVFTLVFSSIPAPFAHTASAKDKDLNSKSTQVNVPDIKDKLLQGDFENVEGAVTRIKSLSQSFSDSGDTVSALDPFSLLPQSAVDKRREIIEAQKSQIQAADFEDRKKENLDFFSEELRKDKARTIGLIGEEALTKARQALDLPDYENHMEEIFKAARTDDLVAEHLGITPENLEDFIDESVPRRHLYKMRLQLQVVNDKGVIEYNIEQKKFEGSLSYSYSSKGLYLNRKNQNLSFQIATDKGEVIHTFSRSVDALGFFGKFLVYIEHSDLRQSEGESVALKFIDLDYFKGAVGNGVHLPVFSLPLKTSHKIESFEINAGHLKINDIELTSNAIDFISKFYRVWYNIAVALADQKTLSSGKNLITELSFYLDKSLSEADEVTKQMISSAAGDLEKVRELAKSSEKWLEIESQDANSQFTPEVMEGLQKVREINQDSATLQDIDLIEKLGVEDNQRREEIQKTNRAVMASRKFLTRLRMMMAYLTHPRPMGAPTLLKTMAMVSAGVINRDNNLRLAGLRELKQHSLFKYGKYGVPVVAAAALGSQLPEPYTLNLYKSLDLVEAMISHAQGYLAHIDYGRNYGRLLGIAAETEMSGLVSLNEAYVENGRFPKLMVLLGATVTIPFIIFAIPHLIGNGIRTGSYIRRNKEEWKLLRSKKGKGRIATFKEMFISYQREQRETYDKIQSEAESSMSGGSSTLNEHQEAVLDEVIKKQNGVRKKRGTKKFNSLTWTSTQNVKIEGKPEVFFEQVENEFDHQKKEVVESIETGAELEEGLTKNKKLTTIKTFGKALRHFLLSYPSATNTWKSLATTWNYFFIFRSFVLRPRTWYMTLAYPRYFRTAISSVKDQLHMPSALNEGLTPARRYWPNRIKELFGKEGLKQVRRFERAIVPFEAAAYRMALEKSLAALFKYESSSDELLSLFDSTQLPKSGLAEEEILAKAKPSSGIGAVTDNKLSKISKKQRLFFRAYFDLVLQRSTAEFLRRFAVQKGEDPSEIAKLTTKELKAKSVQWAADLEVVEAVDGADNSKRQAQLDKIENEMKIIVDQLTAGSEFQEVAKEITESRMKAWERKKITYHHDLMILLDPKHPQMNRFLTAERQIEKPKAMQRAARAEISSMFVDKPLGLAAILLLYAGINDGSIFQPLHDTMFGPNSLFYGSRHLFFNEFALGAIIGIMANTWMKVQEDQRIDDLGRFDKVPTKQDADKGFWRYYFKNLLKNPSNKWASNQAHYTRLIWANIPAAFVTISIGNFLTLGRFDLGMFLAGYIITFATPLMGIGLKIEQAFELSTSWVAAKVPRQLRAGAVAQQWVNAKIQARRIQFSLGNGLYGTLLGPMIGMFELMNTEAFGKRSFLSLLLFGWQPEEIVSAGLQKMTKYLGWIPGVEHLAETCESLLTNNNTALDASKLMNDPVSK